MLARRILIALIIVTVIQVIVYYPQMPEVSASHFDGSGHPNGWMSRNVFFAMHLGIVALLAFVFLFLPSRLRFISYKTWNIPNRDYWMSPERRQETTRIIQDQMLWCGAASMGFIIVVIQLAIEANLNRPGVLSSAILWLLIAYMVFMVSWAIRMIVRFSKIPK